MTTLTITPDVAKKKLKLVGKVATGEKVFVTVLGFGDVDAENLRVRVAYGGCTVGMFPLDDGDAWAVDGADLNCTLNLNTEQAAHYCKLGAPVDVLLEDTEIPQLYGAADFQLLPWIKCAGIDVPVNLDNYKVKMTALEREVTQTHSALNAHLGNRNNPHGVTKGQLGLGSVDNTSDSAKPVSIAQQAAINAARQEASAAVLAEQHRAIAIETENRQMIYQLQNEIFPKSSLAPLIGETLPDTATQKDVRVMLQTILGVLKNAAVCIALAFALPAFGIDGATAWEDVPPQVPVKNVVEQFSPPADFSTNNQELVETIQAKASMSESDPVFSEWKTSPRVNSLKIYGTEFPTGLIPIGGNYVDDEFEWYKNYLAIKRTYYISRQAVSNQTARIYVPEFDDVKDGNDWFALRSQIPTWDTLDGKPTIPTTAADVGAYPASDGNSLANIVNAWEGYWGGTNVIFEVTNYYGNTSGEFPRLRIKELREGAWQTVWDEETKFGQSESNILVQVAASNRVCRETCAADLAAGLADRAPRAWGTMTDKGSTNVVGNSVWMTAPETYFAGGTEYQRVAVGSGAVCVLTDNGAGAFTAGEAGTFRFQDEGGTNFFGFAKSDSYTIGCKTDGITVDGTLVTLRYDVIMGGTDVPIVYWRLALNSGEWVQLNNADGTATHCSSSARSAWHPPQTV